MTALLRLLKALPLLIVSPLVVLASILSLALLDALWFVTRISRTRRNRPAIRTRTGTTGVSVVIPNWQGRDLLEKYLPSVEAALSGNPDNEIVVVDNASTDGSVEFVRERFPNIRVVALPENLGFGGGSNTGFQAARHDIVVLLNSDMRVEPDFLAPLLEAFADENVFAVACQIFFTDPAKVREETGLTQGWWEDGMLRVRHRIDPEIKDLYPCFYGGGGSCAFDRHKFLALGGFDRLFEPFYLEDTDLGYQAWKRGWKVLYQPRSVVYHEHRGTIGKKFGQDRIQAVLKKNFLLFCWKNIHEWPRLAGHFFFAYAGALVSAIFGNVPSRPDLAGLCRAFLSLPQAMRSRWRARALAVVSDTEAFLRPLGGYFRDRFADVETEPDRLRVLFVSPYPILPPVHGGGVFMHQTLRELAKLSQVHVIALLDTEDQRKANQALQEFCASAEFLVRMEGHRSVTMGSLLPHAVMEFRNCDLEWLIHRKIYTHAIDVVQLEYTPLGQYAGRFHRLATALFEHDIYFQSVARSLEHMPPLRRAKARFEYLRALRYELKVLPQCDRVQVCTRENKEYIASFLPSVASRLDEGMRAGIDTTRYRFHSGPRQPFTMLFLGSFRHAPNQVALDWFAGNVLPRIRERRPEARLVVAGSDPPPRHAFGDAGGAIELLGFVDEIRSLLEEMSVFVCPILNGSGVRVKLLEAFAAGIPVISTRVGAEGLARRSGEFCLLADSPDDFAQCVVELFENPEEAARMARRAREEVVANWDMATLTRRLERSYREAVRAKRNGAHGTALAGTPISGSGS
ncbi:MAG: glycosyltransferase [Bryobacteraceae bacterium]